MTIVAPASRFSMRALGGVLVFLTAAIPARSAPTGQASESEQIHQLQDRVAQLEQTVAELKAMVQAANPVRPAAPVPANAPEQLQAANPAPAAQTPAPIERKARFEMPPELIPDIGKIGAEVGVFLSGSSSPFKLNNGSFAGGYIDLPLFDRPSWLHGKISYEISIGLTQSKTTFSTTSNVAQVANLSVLNALYPAGGLSNVQAALTGSGAAPFPVTTSTQTKLSLLQVIPFALKYTPTVLDRYRIRPYAVAGFGPYITIHVQNPAQGNPASYGVRQDANLPPAILSSLNALFSGQAPFGGPLVAGQISQSPELEARGLPGGHGNIALGYQLGGGLAFRITRSFSLGFDARYNRMSGTNGSFVTYGTRFGFHF